ncbi:MAG: fumarylacetoacetate hydrolase family protein [Candidatus Heimdallarchaeaceae archaeon]
MLVGKIAHGKRTFPVLFDSKEDMVYEIFTTMRELLRQNLDEIDLDSSGIPLEEVCILPPVQPSKIICIGRNYVEHAKEFGNLVPEEPLLFFKPPSCLIPHGGKVIYPSLSKRVDFEGELALVIKKRLKRIDAKKIEANPQEYFGYTPFLDMTARDIQKSDKLWTRGKGFDTFGPIGPWIEFNTLPSSLSIQTYVNDEIRQDSNINLMVHSPSKLIEYITKVMTLEPGDVVATGTPSGVGPVNIGDRIKLQIGGLPTLEVQIVKEQK